MLPFYDHMIYVLREQLSLDELNGVRDTTFGANGRWSNFGIDCSSII